MSLRPHRALVTAGGRELRAVADNELLAAHVRDVVLRNVVAERPHQLRHGDFRTRRHRAIAGWVELEKPDLAGGIPDREAGRHAVALRRDDRPCPRCGTRRGVGADRDVRCRHRPVSDSIREPARVGDLVNGVHVLGADVGTLRSGQHVVGQVDDQVDLERLHRRSVLRIVLDPDRVVVIEPRRRSGREDGEGCSHHQRAEDAYSGIIRSHGMSASSVLYAILGETVQRSGSGRNSG